MTRMSLSKRIATIATLVSLMLAALSPAYASAERGAITFAVYMGDSCVFGNATASDTVKFLWKGADGQVKVRASVSSGGDGSWMACYGLVEAGDVLKATDSFATRTYIVPRLTLLVNRVTDMYRGRGPAGEYVRLTCGRLVRFESCGKAWKIRVNSEGRWSFRPDFDVRGGDLMGLRWLSPQGDFVGVFSQSPFISLTVGKAGAMGATRNGAPVSVLLQKAYTLKVRGKLTATGDQLDGGFSGRFENRFGDKVQVRVGDVVTSDIATDANWTVFDIQATANSSTGHVTGRCEPGLQVVVEIHVRGESGAIEYEHLYTDAQGMFDSTLPFHAGNDVFVSCSLATGDWLSKWFVAV